MEYRLELSPLAKQQIASWGLATTYDYLLVDINIRLRDVAKRPTEFLVRDEDVYDGMVFSFEVIDPHNRLCRHLFVFHFMYSMDERSLIVSGAGYQREIGI